MKDEKLPLSPSGVRPSVKFLQPSKTPTGTAARRKKEKVEKE